jgi:hypothetical protein
MKRVNWEIVEFGQRDDVVHRAVFEADSLSMLEDRFTDSERSELGAALGYAVRPRRASPRRGVLRAVCT